MAGSLNDAVRALAAKETGWKEFLPKQASPVPASAGKASNALPKAAAAAGGLTEKNYAARKYHPRRTLKSTDGVITWLFDPIKSVEMTDAAGSTVTWTFAEPTA